MSDDTAGMTNRERVAWLVKTLKADADPAEVARIIASIERMLSHAKGMRRASVIVACAKILATQMEQAPDGQELEAYFSVHGMIDGFLGFDAAETTLQ